METGFLKKFIDIAEEDGVNEKTLFKASENFYGENRAYILHFYKGLSDIVEQIENMFDAELDNIDLHQIISITQKVRILLNARIYGLGERRKIYRALSDFYKSKIGYSIFLKSAWKTIDKIWYLVGDKSLDWNYYTKRALLFTIYLSSLRFFVHSDSCSAEELDIKINKNLERVGIFNRLKKKFSPDNIPFIRLLRK